MATKTRAQAGTGRRSRDVASSLVKKKSEAPAPGAITVTATAKGFHGATLRHPGDEFTIDSLDQFSDKWMRRGSASSVSGKAETTAGSGTGAAGSGDPLGD